MANHWSAYPPIASNQNSHATVKWRSGHLWIYLDPAACRLRAGPPESGIPSADVRSTTVREGHLLWTFPAVFASDAYTVTRFMVPDDVSGGTWWNMRCSCIQCLLESWWLTMIFGWIQLLGAAGRFPDPDPSNFQGVQFGSQISACPVPLRRESTAVPLLQSLLGCSWLNQKGQAR